MKNQSRDKSRASLLRTKFHRILANIKSRCTDHRAQSFPYYGGKGIGSELTLADLYLLYVRDGACFMAQASIDRKNSAIDYTVENCRFIEFSANRTRRIYFRLKCRRCGERPGTISRGFCADCRKYLASLCGYCGLNEHLPGRRLCESCAIVTRPCSSCGENLIRDIGHHAQVLNRPWFCDTHCRARYWVAHRSQA